MADRLTEAWQSVKAGLVRGLSIGFSGLEQAQIKDSFSLHFLKWEWLELSLVTIPANSEATIQAVKSFDAEQRATFGQRKGAIWLGDSRPVGRKPGAIYLLGE